VSDRADRQVDYRDSVGIVTVRAEMDIVRAHDLREQLLGAVRNEDLGLVVDLTSTTYIDSVGVSLLFELAERLSERQLRLAVVLPEAGLVERVLRIVNLDSVTEIHPTVDEAVGAIRTADGGSPA
jgi:anti-anti-sigma factor